MIALSKSRTVAGTAIKRIEMRRCVACRQVRHKSELVRVAKVAAKISLDTSGKLGGRGAYVCKSAECVQTLKKRRNLDKVFKLKVPDELYDTIKETVLM